MRFITIISHFPATARLFPLFPRSYQYFTESKQDYEKAMPILKDSLNARQRALGESHIDVAKVFALIGKVHDALGESDSAVLCFEEALEIAKQVHGSESEEATEYLLDLAAALVAEDESDKAEVCVDGALRTFHAKQIHNHSSVAKCSCIKAMICEKERKLDTAREWYMKSVQILDSLLPDVASKEFLDDIDLHDKYLELAATLFKFANVDDMLGDEREAINLYRRSLHLYRSLQGEDHLNVANVQYHMALMLGRHEQFDKTTGLLQDALRIRVNNLGKDHPEVAACLFAIGVAHDKNQKYEDAILTYQECMRIQKLEYGPESIEVATTLENYGIAKGNSNDLRGAVESWEEGLEIMMSLGHDETNPLIVNLAGHREIALLLLGESKADESEVTT
jgi:tetratricopeptide (TPR) repeat protein